MFKTKTIKAILEPVTQQIENLLIIGDYIDKGIEIPNLSNNILKISDATNQLLNVLKRIIANAKDEIFKDEVKNSTNNFNESIEKLNKCAQLYQVNSFSKDAGMLLNDGANSILNEVLLVLTSYDDMQVRKIEEFLDKIILTLQQPINFNHDNICNSTEELQPYIINALKLLTPRVKEVLSQTISNKIELGIDELRQNTQIYLDSLNEFMQLNNNEVNEIYKTKIYYNRSQIIINAIYLKSLLYIQDLKLGDLELFIKNIDLYHNSLNNWSNNSEDISSKYMIDYLLAKYRKFQNKYHIVENNFDKKLENILIEYKNLLDTIQNNKLTPSNEVRQFINDFNSLKDDFITWYNDHLKELMNQDSKSYDILSTSPSSINDFNEWYNHGVMLTQIANNFIESMLIEENNGKLAQKHDDLKKSVHEINDQLLNRNIQDEFNNKGKLYHGVNKNLSQLAEMINDNFCENNLQLISDISQNNNDLNNKINELNSENESEFINSSQIHAELLQNKLDTLNKMAIIAVNNYPITLEDLSTFEKNLGYLNYLNDHLQQSIYLFAHNPKDQNVKNELITSLNQIDRPLNSVEENLINIFPYQNIYSYILSKYNSSYDNFKASSKSPSITDPDIFQMMNCLQILEKKLKFEHDHQTDEEVKNNIQAYIDEISKCHNDLNIYHTEYCKKGDDFSKNNLIKNLQNGKEIIEKCSIFLPPKQQEIPIKDISPPSQATIPDKVPEKYREAFDVITNPDSDDRLAKAASELHNQINKSGQNDWDLPKAVLEVSYVFANMSMQFKDLKQQSQVIDSAKQIANMTQNIVDIAKSILSKCKDKRLIQLLGSAIEKLPTISHQLKIMSTLRSSRYKASGDLLSSSAVEANEMLIDCAENLMKSMRDVVKAAEAVEFRNRPKLPATNKAASIYSDL